MVNFPGPMETTSLRGLALVALVRPKKGVALTTVLELAAIAMLSVDIELFRIRR